MTTLALYNLKGGVGKTASAVNLSYLSARSGARTLLWDLDPQGAATFYFRIKPKIKGGRKRLIRKMEIASQIRGTDFQDLDLIPADFSLRHLDLSLDRAKKPRRQLARIIRPLTSEYDYLFLDCPPNMSLVSEGIFFAADALLVPLIPTPLSLRGLDQLSRHLRKSGRSVPVLPFFCMVDRRKSLHRTTGLAETLRPPVLNCSIPYSSQVEQMGVHRLPLQKFSPGSGAAVAYRKLWHEIETRLREISKNDHR